MVSLALILPDPREPPVFGIAACVVSLLSRFSEFDLPEWRTKTEVDRANHHSLLAALEQPEPGSTILVAEDENGVPAGFIHLQTQTDYFTGEKNGYISDMVVSRVFEGQGVDRMLLEAAESWANEHDFRLLTLYVFAGNIHAQRVYEKYGLQQEVIKRANAKRTPITDPCGSECIILHAIMIMLKKNLCDKYI